MYRFFRTRSARHYVLHGDQLYLWHEREWVKTDRTLADLQLDGRLEEVASEDDFGTVMRWAFRRQFQFDSRRVCP